MIIRYLDTFQGERWGFGLDMRLLRPKAVNSTQLSCMGP